ncbi:MAG: enoyl-CoA hydratase/isomerase family protein [Alphaproteobacteria bacterium]|nr:enoyl-CoA hydratase/isomerase family protein [Alphaproteobacteria bacterium]
MAALDYETKGPVAVLALNNPPVNALAQAVCRGLKDGLARALADPAVRAILVIGRGRGFCAGADISEFGKPRPPDAVHLRHIVAAFDGSQKPIVAAIHGNALGGGLELALACHWRVGVAAARLGLPEVKIGLLPGAGGTVRLPRLIGAEQAVKIMTTGEPIDGKAALACGLLDELVEGDLEAAGLAYAQRVLAENRPVRRTRDLPNPAVAPDFFDKTKAALKKSSRGFEAPLVNAEVIEKGVQSSVEQAEANEHATFDARLKSPESKALIHSFFAERKAASIPDVPADTPTRPIKQAAVIGAGTMGGGIAMNFANAGIPVVLMDTTQEAVERGLKIIASNYARTVERGRMTTAEMDQRMALIKPATSYDALGAPDIVIEAVFEEMAVKKTVFGELDRVCPQGTILATNTSTLDVDEMAAVTKRPEAVIGTHFFSPANVMRLCEVVRGKASSKEVIATTMKLTRDLKKVGVLVGVCEGFVGNRMLHGYLREANFLIEEGALPHEVDAVITGFGFPMGPFAMGDLAGLDVGWRIRKGKAATRPNHLRYSPIGDRLCEQGRFGQKTGGGWYKYEKGDRSPKRDPEVEALIVATSKELGIERRAVSEREILERCLYPLINEAAKILDEGLAQRASDIDVIWLNGYGFPAHRGGPMHYADTVGAKVIYDAVRGYEAAHGEIWRPAKLLERLAAENGRFADLNRE